MAEGDTPQLLQYAPFSSTVETGFWHKFSQMKLEVYGLKESPVSIRGFYTFMEAPNCQPRLTVDFSAFKIDDTVDKGTCLSQGTLLLKNTMEDFKKCDKPKILDSIGSELWEEIISGRAMEDPSLLSKFFALIYADLKKYHFYYWFAFPAPCFPDALQVKPPCLITDVFTENQMASLRNAFNNSGDIVSSGYFLVHIEGEDICLLRLQQLCNFPSSTNLMLGFLDPCTLPEYPGWPLRNLLALVSYHWQPASQAPIQVVCVRVQAQKGELLLKNSIVATVQIPDEGKPLSTPRFVGWEKNERSKFGPRMVNLSVGMDPTKLAESSVDLNLKLMKWRLLPSLNLERIQKTRCLLLGAGTLGCSVARSLMAWGIRFITFVDNGNVSYSNPVRQSLYEHADCLNGGRLKAEAAAEALKKIHPGVISSGHQLTIPMPGHALDETLLKEIKENVQILDKLIQDHDVIFLLMDTRESRWLPTLLGAVYGKLVINAALGFDSCLVMRHGLRDVHATSDTAPSSDLGCYFCNDVVAPGDSTKDRTLDQQCTVTRPGISTIASSIAAEMAVSVISHEKGASAPATISGEFSKEEEAASPLGTVPHSIRFFLSHYEQITPSTPSFDKCTACSPVVLKSYMTEGFDFIEKVLWDPSYLQDHTGLTALHQEVENSEVWEIEELESE